MKRAASDIWAVLRNPKKAMQLFGGDLAGNLIYPFLLGLCLLAFGVHLSFAQLVVVQVGAGMLGNVAPVPGGIGVQEAALTAGLTAFGIDSNTALGDGPRVPRDHVRASRRSSASSRCSGCAGAGTPEPSQRRDAKLTQSTPKNTVETSSAPERSGLVLIALDPGGRESRT